MNEAIEVFEYVQGSTGKKMVRLALEDFEAIIAELQSRGLDIKEEIAGDRIPVDDGGINILGGGN